MDGNLVKSFTDFRQSKKLLGILSIETADMFHFIHEVDTVGFGYKKDAEEFYSKTKFEYLPCWSLSALLNILPDKICFDNETYYLNCNKKEVKYLGPLTCDGQKSIVSTSDNLLDGCYKMIRTLHELKIL